MPEGGTLREGWMIVIRLRGSLYSSGAWQVINNKRREGKYYDVGCQDIFGYY